MFGRDQLLFTRALARSPRQVGAVVPSSAALGERLAAVVPATEDAVIVELGTGAVTEGIERRRPRSTFLAFERDAELARQLARRVPGVRVILDDARNLRAELAEHDVGMVDAVVCGFAVGELHRTRAVWTPRRHL